MPKAKRAARRSAVGEICVAGPLAPGLAVAAFRAALAMDVRSGGTALLSLG